MGEDWKTAVFQLLKERDRIEREQFSPAFDAYARLMTKISTLQTRNLQLEQELGRSSPTHGGGGHSDEKMLKLHQELTESYKEKAEMSAQIVRLKEQNEKDEHLLVVKDAELQDLKKQLAAEKEKEGVYNVNKEHLSLAVNHLRNELSQERMHVAKLEEQVRQLTDENNSLIERLLEFKGNQAEEMNKMNQLLQQARKKQSEEQKIAAEVDLSSENGILDAVAWQSNFNVTVPTGQKRRIVAHRGQVTGVRYNHNGSLLISSGTDSLVKVWDSRSGMERAVLRGSQQTVMSACFSPDDQLVMAVGNDQTARMWSMKTSRVQHTLLGHTNKIYAGTFSVDSEKIMTGSHDRSIRIWDCASGKSTLTIPCHSSCNYLSPAPNAHSMASAHLDQHVRFWSIRTGELIHELNIHKQQATCVEFARDGNLCVTTARDDIVHLVDVRTYNIVKSFCTIEGMKGPRYATSHNWSSVVFSPDDQFICAGSVGGEIFIWNVESGKLEKILEAPGLSGVPEKERAVVQVAWNRNGRQLVGCDNAGHLRFWE